MLKFRIANIADIDALNILVNSAYRGDSSRQGWTTEANLLDGQRTDLDSLRELINSPNNTIVVAEQGQEIVACSCLTTTGDSASLGMITTKPNLQGQGIGKQIIEESERIAKNKGLTTITMFVIDVRSELIAFYQRRNYKPTGQTKPFPYGNPKFGLPKREDLKFIILEKKL